MKKVKLSSYFNVFTFVKDYWLPLSYMRWWAQKHSDDIKNDTRYYWGSKAIDELQYILERPFTFDGADKVNEKTLKRDSQDLYDACFNAAAFTVGGWICSPMTAVNEFISLLSDADREEFLERVYLTHHPWWHVDTVYSLKTMLFGNFFYEVCPAYKAYADERCKGTSHAAKVDLSTMAFNVSCSEANYLLYVTHLYRIPTKMLPPMWLNIEKYKVPSSNEPFSVTKNKKNVVTITDGAIIVKLKLLSDREHMVMSAVYSDGRQVEDDAIRVMLDYKTDPQQRGFLFVKLDQPNLYSLTGIFTGTDAGYCSGPCRLTYKHGLKSVKFSF